MSLKKRTLVASMILVTTAGLSALHIPAVAADLDFVCDDPVQFTEMGTYVEIDAVITNTGAQGDRFDLLRTIVYRPAPWTTPMCVGSCYSDVVDSLTVLLNPGESDTVAIRFNAIDVDGGAIVSYLARSWLDTNVKKTVTMAAITTETEVLILDDDGGQEYQDYLSAAFDGIHTWGVWPRDLESPVSSELAEFDVVAWMTGEALPTLAPEDTLAVGAFLDGGGRLFVTGQNIGYDMCDPASSNYTTATKDFYETRLGARYIADDTAVLTVEGVASDPITDGLTLAISGGDGAGNQTAPSEIATEGAGSTSIFTYQGTSKTAGVRVEKNDYRAVNLAFGFEAISTAQDRADLTAEVYDWLVSFGAVETDFRTAGAGPELHCYPNPFNPSVTISLRVPETGAASSVDIFDLAGRRVASLPVAPASSGSFLVEWDGKDAGGRRVASGMYTARVKVDPDTVLTEKLILLK